MVGETHGKDDRIFALLANRLAGSGRFDLSEKAARSGLAVNSQNRANRFALCTVLLGRAEQSRRTHGQYRDADLSALRECEDLADRALQLNSSDAWMLVFRGRSRIALGKKEEGMADLRTAVSCRPDLIVTQFNLGEALLDAGKLDEAREALGRARRLAPPDDKNLAEALRRLADEEARSKLRSK
jgi:tetratricopeptide (TPR) repeat protein